MTTLPRLLCFCGIIAVLSGCDSLMHTTESVEKLNEMKHERQLKQDQRAHENATIQNMCNNNQALVGVSQGYRLALDAKYNELTTAKGEVTVERFRKLQQELQNYSAEWEILNQAIQNACRALAITMARENSDTRDIQQAREAYNQQLREGFAFVQRIEQLG